MIPKRDSVNAFLASKRLEVLYEEGLISLSERLGWEAKLDRSEVDLSEVEALFARLWRKADGSPP